ncbi:hypothetical protein [Bacillus sp. AK031]
MAKKYSPELDLYLPDPVTEGNDNFNLDTILNENWGKIDEFAKTHQAERATPTTLGHVKAETDEEGNLILPESQSVWEVIADVELASHTYSVVFQNLDLNLYRYLKLIIKAKIYREYDYRLKLTFNDNENEIYSSNAVGGYNSAGMYYKTGQRRFAIDNLPKASGKFASITVDIQNLPYKEKTIDFSSFYIQNGTAPFKYAGSGVMDYTSQITKIYLSSEGPVGENLAAGSTFTLLGVK